MVIKGLLLVWFIFIVYRCLFDFIARSWHRHNRLRSLRSDFPLWLYVLTAFYILYIIFSIVYTISWICNL